MVCKIWSQNEIDNILLDLKTKPINEVNEKYKRTSQAIFYKLKSLNINIDNIEYSRWTSEQEDWLKQNYNNFSNQHIMDYLNKDLDDIRLKSKKLNLGKKLSNPINAKAKTPKTFVKPHIWTNEQDQYLIKNFQLLSFEEMESTLKLSKRIIYKRANDLGLKRNNVRIRSDSFTIYELETLKVYYGSLPIKELLKLLPRKNEDQINRKAKSLKLHKMKLTLPEEKVENIINDLKLKYLKQVKFNFGEKYYLCDFIINEKIVIEVNGDYWHGNPSIYSYDSLNKMQKDMIERDKIKKRELENIGYKVIYIWEYDLIHNYEYCKSQIKNALLL